MLSRIKGSSAGILTRIPRKGRIRFVLALLLLAFSFRFAVGFFKSPRKEEPNEKKACRETGTQKRGWFRKTVQGEKLLSAADVSRLLKTHPISLQHPTDTVSTAGNDWCFHTAVDTALQSLIHILLARYHPEYGAAVAMEPATGRILAMVSYTYKGRKEIASNLTLKSIYPAASIFKVVTAAAALERAGLTPETTIPHTGKNHTLYRFQLRPTLRNKMDIPFRNAFSRSINPVFARLGIYHVGKQNLAEYATRFGFGEKIPFELPVEVSQAAAADSDYALGEIACGFNQQTTLSPLLGALIAAAVSESGAMPKPLLVDSVTDIHSGRRVYKADSKVWKAPIRAGTARDLRRMMRQVTVSGTARKSFRYLRRRKISAGLDYGGKTGSVDMEGYGRADWFMGYCRNPETGKESIVTAVITIHSEYWNVHSSYLGARIFCKYFQQLERKKRKQKSESSE